VDDNVLVVYILLEFDKPLEVALMGYWFLSWHGRRRRKIKKLVCVCMWKVVISREQTWEVKCNCRKGESGFVYHECIAKNEASEVMS